MRRCCSGVATGGGQAGQLLPPPTSNRTPREINADPRRFSCRKNGGRFTGFAPTFYMRVPVYKGSFNSVLYLLIGELFTY